LSRLICDRFVKVLAVSQQFNRRARRGSAGNDRVTVSLNTGDVEGRFGSVGI
jgi:hypothetical protein